MNPFVRRIYYIVKPLIPRSVQIHLRRKTISRLMPQYAAVWPIDESSARKPAEWTGWPEGKQFAFVLTHDVDTYRGQRRCSDVVDLEIQLGFRSSFNFVPERYRVSLQLRQWLTNAGFEVGVHGLNHDGKYFYSRQEFTNRAIAINHYLNDWKAVGFRSPSMQHNLEWFHDLNIEYDASTFDTDPFEPQPQGVATIFPFLVTHNNSGSMYIELPYTLPQDFTLFVLLRERNIDIWKRKLDWVASKGGMVLMNVHPDYMNFDSFNLRIDEYPASYYKAILEYAKSNYEGLYWNALPRDVARFCKEIYANRL